MGTTTPNISIYIPAAGETNYDASFAAGMVNIDQHDHSGAPNKGVPIAASGIAAGAVTFDKLNANVADNATGIGTAGSLGANQLSILGLLKAIYQIATATGFIAKNGALATARTMTGTANQIAIANGAGVAGNPTYSLAPIVLNPTQPAFLANADVQANVTGDGTNFVPVFTLATTGPTIPPLFNQGGYFNGSGTFTPPVTGIYMVHCDLALSGITAAHTTAEIKLFINGAAVYSDFNGNIGAVRNAGNGFIISINQICQLTAADTLKIQLTISGGALVITIDDGTFSAVLLC